MNKNAKAIYKRIPISKLNKQFELDSKTNKILPFQRRLFSFDRVLKLIDG
jgi:hypothetical protein